MRYKILRTLLLLLFCQAAVIHAQEYRIHNYGMGEGLSYPFVYTVNQDSKGYIWLGTGQGLNRFNGFSFISENPEDSLASQVAAVSVKDSSGKLWFGYQSGDLAVLNNIRFGKINTGMAESSITGIAELRQGNVLVATQNSGLFCVSGKSNEITKTEGLPQILITSVCVDGNALIIGSMEGLYVCAVDNEG